MTFKDDGTLATKYSDVVFNSGKQTRIEKRVLIEFDAKKSGTGEPGEERNSTVRFYCDHTISIISENSSRNSNYYKNIKMKAYSDKAP